jgi:hypothetical protein
MPYAYACPPGGSGALLGLQMHGTSDHSDSEDDDREPGTSALRIDLEAKPRPSTSLMASPLASSALMSSALMSSALTSSALTSSALTSPRYDVKVAQDKNLDVKKAEKMKPKKGYATPKQRLGKILKMHKFGH